MLYIIATPIGNLKDITLRSLEVLQTVDSIICEDTRRTFLLLNHYQIKKPLLILNDFNEVRIVPQIIEKLKKVGHVITLLRVKNTLLIFHFSDELRSDVHNIVQTLNKTLQIAMLTGDHKDNAQFIADKIGIKTVFADLSPADKLRIIRELGEKTPLMMVGDGINDAPALSQAMVGIAMGKVGSATAIEAADVVLLRDDIAMIGWLHRKSRQTMWIVRQNLTLALAVIAITTTCSLLGFVPLWLAVILHEGSTVAVGCNSLRLFLK